MPIEVSQIEAMDESLCYRRSGGVIIQHCYDYLKLNCKNAYTSKEVYDGIRDKLNDSTIKEKSASESYVVGRVAASLTRLSQLSDPEIIKKGSFFYYKNSRSEANKAARKVK